MNDTMRRIDEKIERIKIRFKKNFDLAGKKLFCH